MDYYGLKADEASKINQKRPWQTAQTHQLRIPKRNNHKRMWGRAAKATGFRSLPRTFSTHFPWLLSNFAHSIDECINMVILILLIATSGNSRNQWPTQGKISKFTPTTRRKEIKTQRLGRLESTHRSIQFIYPIGLQLLLQLLRRRRRRPTRLARPRRTACISATGSSD